MRALKALVIGLGVCALVAFVVLVLVITQRGGGKPGEGVAGAGVRPPTHASWGRVMLDQPVGTRIHSVTSHASLIVVQLYTGMPGQDERLVVLDPSTGAVVGSFMLPAAAK
jgi:hypothetical protein